MFVCDNCLRQYENAPSIARSEGACELCGKHAVCSDIPSKYLRRKKVRKFYVAASWKSIETVREIWRHLEREGHLYYDWSAHGYLVGEIEKENVAFLRDHRVRKTFESDVCGLAWCDTFVLVAPGGNSSHIETGIVYGTMQSPRMILIAEKVPKDCFYNVFDAFYADVETFVRKEC